MPSSSNLDSRYLMAMGFMVGGILLAFIVGLVLFVTIGWQIALLVASPIFGLGFGAGLGTFVDMRNRRNDAT